LGVDVPVFTGAERIAREYNIPVVFADIQRVKRGFYEVTFKVISDQSKETKTNEITDTFIELLEAQIYKDPTQYLWSHNRFKHRHLKPVKAS
jgi:KDO2-lipid IV(A) lauroyltransferase